MVKNGTTIDLDRLVYIDENTKFEKLEYKDSVVYYRDYECLGDLVKELTKNNLIFFDVFINHKCIEKSIDRYKNCCLIYCDIYKWKIKPCGKLAISLDFDIKYYNVFYDSRHYEIDYDNGVPFIEIVVNEETCGFYNKERNLLILSDVSHKISNIPAAVDLFRKLKIALENYKDIDKLKSQKAIGIKFIERLYPKYSLPSLFITDKNQIDNINEDYLPVSFYGKLFIRACPLKPRHGILESRISDIDNVKKDLKEIFENTEKIDEHIECVIQPFIDADCSAVWSKGLIAIGRGHDGITAGRDFVAYLSSNEPDFHSLVLKALDLKDCEYEFVYDIKNYGLRFVQIREATNHFKPNSKPKGKNIYSGFVIDGIVEMKNIKNIVVLEGLENIEKLEKFSGKDNLCVHIGGNLLSHAAAWCRQNYINYIAIEDEEDIDKIKKFKYLCEISKGWVKLSNRKLKAKKIKIDWNFDAFKEGFNAIMESKISKDYAKELFNLLPFFHDYISGNFTNKENAYLAGLFAGTLTKIGIAIVFGELRYLSHKCENNPVSLEDVIQKTFKEVFNIDYEFSDSYEVRDKIYDDIFALNLSDYESVVNLMQLAIEGFSYNWESAYGGHSWQKIAKQIKDILLCKTRDCLLNKLNKFLNYTHNNGWAFNKLIYPKIMDIVYTDNIVKLEIAMRGFAFVVNKTFVEGIKASKKIVWEEK